jgi:hypothetical protein
MAVNSYYPKDYFNLPGVDTIAHPNELWWSSQERAAVVDGSATTECLEIDFGRIREINYLTFDIVKKPIDIRVFYDATSFDDGSHTWTEVQPLPDYALATFDRRVDFDGSSNAWMHAQFYFADALGNSVAPTRFVLITFTRRDQIWPSSAIPADIWSIDVANLRTARYMTNLDDARGILINTVTPTGELDQVDLQQYVEVRQPFTMPDGYVRGDSGINVRDPVITPIVPNVVGFGFLVDVQVPPGAQPGTTVPDLSGVEFEWEFLDVSKAPLILASGIQRGATNIGKCWIDVLFEPTRPIPTTQNSQFELVIRSRNLDVSHVIYARSPNPLGAGALTDFYTVVSDPTTNTMFMSRQDNASLIYRIWADIGESGKDVLGNQYREGVRRDSSTNVTDHVSGSSWYSMPTPAADAVECLYFDVRTRDSDGNLVSSVIDALNLNPATPGPYMHMYYSVEGASLSNHAAPVSIRDWESILWTPVPATFVLDKNHTYDLPRPIRAAWICLEFSNLQPVPFPLPEIPELPAVQYKTYPTWLRNLFAQNSTYRGNPNDVSSITNNTQTVRGNVFDDNFMVTDEFTVNSRAVPDTRPNDAFQATTVASLDPVTLAQISLRTPRVWTGNQAANVQGGIFANYISSRAQATGAANAPSEALPIPTAPSVQTVSTVGKNASLSYAEIATDPIYFDRVCRHATDAGGYRVVRAQFNKKAYYVGISDVKFFRKDYTVERDDPVIHDILAESNLVDSPLIELNTWANEAPSNIGSGQTIYVTYMINGVQYTDEPIQFEQPDDDVSFEPVILFNNGGRATNVQVKSGSFNTGSSFSPGTDYDIAYDSDTLTNSILRSSAHWRLVASKGKKNVDNAVVIGRSFVFADDSHIVMPEDVTVPGTAIPFTSFEEFTSTGATQYFDNATIIGRASIDSTDLHPPRNFVDGDTVIDNEVISATETFSGAPGLNYVDSAAVVSNGVISGADLLSRSYVDAGTGISTGIISGTEAYTRLGVPGFIGRPLSTYPSTTTPTALTPIMSPYMPDEVLTFPVSSMRTYVTTPQAGSLIFAVYTYAYTAAGTFSAQLVATTSAVSTSVAGVKTAPILGGPITLDFNVNKYMFGFIASGTPPATFSAASVGAKTGTVAFNAPLASITNAAWPATFTQSAVSSSNIRPYIVLLTTEGEQYI